MKQSTRGEKQTASTPKELTIVLQPGQVLKVIADNGSSSISRTVLERVAAGATSDAPDISPSRDPDSSISPSLSRDRSGRP